MKNRLQNRLIKKAGAWAVKQILTSLPLVGVFFNIVFFAVELVSEARKLLREAADTESAPQLVLLAA